MASSETCIALGCVYKLINVVFPDSGIHKRTKAIKPSPDLCYNNFFISIYYYTYRGIESNMYRITGSVYAS